MDWWLLTFFLGAILSLFLPEVPAIFPLFLLLCIAIGCCWHKKLRFSSGLWFGALWMLAQAYLYHSQLPNTYIALMHDKQPFFIVGEVLSVQVNPLNSVSINTALSINKPKSKTTDPHKPELTKRFNFRVSKINHQPLDDPIIVRLSWKKPKVDVAQGQNLSLNVKLKPAHGLANVGTFNYISWLKAHNIVATGYVINPRKKKNSGLKNKVTKELTRIPGEKTLKVLNENKLILNNTTSRQELLDQYQNLTPSHQLTPILLALAFGERSLLNPEQWEVLQATGTSHLIAISGLHVGLLAGSAFFIIMLFFKTIPLRNNCWQQINIRYTAIVVSLLFATIYAYLAGFSLPTQRALVMLNLYWLSRVLGIKFSPKRLILITVFILLIISPFSLLTASFWLSFYAVAIIFATLWKFKSSLSQGSAIWRFVKGLLIIQVALTLMLMPITALFFQQISLVSLVANIIAVPWMSAVSIPTALISVFAMPFSEVISQWFMMLSLKSLSWLWYYLELLSQQEYAIISLSLSQQLIISGVGIAAFYLCYLSPLSLSRRIKKGVFILPCIILITFWLIRTYLPQLPLTTTIFSNEESTQIQKVNNQTEQDFNPWQAIFFDVGQGLSVLIKRNEHAILYDTGAAYPSGFNMSDAVVLPHLQYSGIGKLDKVILSHSDNDHAGGISTLIDNIVIDEIMSNDKGIIKAGTSPSTDTISEGKQLQGCEPSQNFSWQGLKFTILWPLKSNYLEETVRRVKQKNDDSCVILITDLKGRKVLLTGDISAKVEQELISLYPKLTVDILQVPHHGSKTSSSQGFLSQLSPDIALVSAGYLNRWNMPVTAVSKRYHDLNIELLNSAVLGQIVITFNEDGIITKNYVEDLRPFWFSH